MCVVLCMCDASLTTTRVNPMHFVLIECVDNKNVVKLKLFRKQLFKLIICMFNYNLFDFLGYLEQVI